MNQNSENRMNESQVVNQIRAQLFANGHSCPLCGQVNFKVSGFELKSYKILSGLARLQHCLSCEATMHYSGYKSST